MQLQKSIRDYRRKLEKNLGQRSWDLLGSMTAITTGLRPATSLLFLSSYCYYFHRRQEVALSRHRITSLPPPYQGVAGCLSWSYFHPNRSLDLKESA